MDTPPPHDVPPEPPILLPASDLPPMEPEDDAATVIPVLRPAPPGMSKSAIWQIVGAGTFVTCLILAGFRYPEAWIFLSLSAILPPMAILPLLAYLGEREPVARALAMLAWLGLMFAMAVVSLQTVTSNPAMAGALPATLAAGGVFAGIVLGLICFLPKVREIAVRRLPMNSESFVHAVGLAGVVGLIIILLVPILVMGAPPALDKESMQHSVDQLQQLQPGYILRLICYGYFWIVIGNVFFVGFPIARSAKEALQRLGLIVPTAGHVAFAVCAAIALLVVFFGVDWAIGHIWDALHLPRTDEKSFNELTKFALSPIGAIVLGVTAGLSEELAIRGVLQPRLGILLSNLLFMAAHAFQYNWDALLSVFLIGLVLGLIRRRFNTTTSAIVHGTYDFLAILATYYEVDPSKWFGS